MANKLTICPHCGAEVASSAKTCPNCGGKVKKPLYKKWWFYLLVAIVVIAIIGGNGNNRAEMPSTNTSISQTNSESNNSTQQQETSNPDHAVYNDPVQQASPKIEYAIYNVTDLFDAINSNAMKAQDTFKDKYVEIHGYLGTIDSSGKYFGLAADENNYDYMFQEVQCYIKTDDQKQVLMEKSKGDAIVVRGQITDVGEVLGYSLNLDSVE